MKYVKAYFEMVFVFSAIFALIYLPLTLFFGQMPMLGAYFLLNVVLCSLSGPVAELTKE